MYPQIAVCFTQCNFVTESDAKQAWHRFERSSMQRLTKQHEVQYWHTIKCNDWENRFKIRKNIIFVYFCVKIKINFDADYDIELTAPEAEWTLINIVILRSVFCSYFEGQLH